METEEKAGVSGTAQREQADIQRAWLKFLVQHPTRGGLVERLIFESGWKACAAERDLR